MTNFEQLVAAIEAAKVDAEKFFGEKQNAQAGTRLSVALRNVNHLAKAIRKEISATKKQRAEAKKAKL